MFSITITNTNAKKLANIIFIDWEKVFKTYFS